MQVSPEQGQFMGLLIRMLGAKKAIEVGTFTGYSALQVALALPDDGRLIACDISEEWTSIGIPFWKQDQVDHKIDLRIGAATETMSELINEGEAGTYDFAFIDADKVNYLKYYELCLTLMRPGGVIAIDNVIWGGAVADPDITDPSTDAIRELNRFVHQDTRVTVSMLPIGDGLTLARKNT
jgi:predicted O-methyltransferase YrrM